MEKQDVKSIFSLDGTRNLIAFLSQFTKKEKPVYNLKSVRIPRTSGRTLKILAFLLRTPGTRSLLIPVLLRQAGIQSLRKCKVEDEPLMHPVHPVDNKITSSVAKKSIQQFFDSLEMGMFHLPYILLLNQLKAYHLLALLIIVDINLISI